MENKLKLMQCPHSPSVQRILEILGIRYDSDATQTITEHVMEPNPPVIVETMFVAPLIRPAKKKAGCHSYAPRGSSNSDSSEIYSTIKTHMDATPPP